MDAIDSHTWLIVLGVVALVTIAVAAAFYYRLQQSQRLQRRFGPEYGRAVSELGSRSKAESELKARQKRVESLHIVPLPPDEAESFSQKWKALQGRFVDDPRGAVLDAEELVRELMQRRGYPMGDFEHRAADISVDHPAVVEHYRAAQHIAERASSDEADTEELRKAVVHFRALFAELLEVSDTRRTVTKDEHLEERT